MVATGGMAIIGSIGGLSMSLSRLPDVSGLQTYVPHETTKIFDAKGHLLANVHGEENRVVIPLKDIPRTVQQAVIAMEDTDFYHHYGVNPKGIGRAFLVNLAEGSSVEGASTLTQQLAKNLFLDPEKTLNRKVAEAWLAIQIEHHYSKSQILEMYLNQVYWGHNAYGIEAASLNYFGKPTRQLNLAESALLAGLLRGPEYYSPYRNPKGAKELQQLVLDRMVVAGYISPAQARTAAKTPLKYPGVTSYEYKVPYFTGHVISELEKKYGERRVLEGGLRVYTTLDLDLQQHAEEMLREGVAQDKVYNIHQGALVAIEPKTGYVKALVGGIDFKKSKFNRAVQALRPPGSTFKPFVYLTALASGYSPGSVVVDEPISLPDGYGHTYSPSNYDHDFRGPLTLRSALEKSVNVIAVKLGYAVGVKNVIKTAHALGITTKLGENLSLPLGTSEVTPYEMCSAYAAIANDGVRCEPTMITKIVDRQGHVLEEHKPQPKRVFDQGPIRLLINMMQDVINHGTGYEARIGRPAGGKTGTTSDERDVWFDGYTPDLACVIWMGNDDNSRLAYSSTGGTVVAPTWAKFMTYALKSTPSHTFPPVGNVTEVTINRRTGRPTNPLDKDAETEIFQTGHEPNQIDESDAAASRTSHHHAKAHAEAPADDQQPAKAEPVAPKPKPTPKLDLSGRKHKHTPKGLENVITTDETLLEPVPDVPDSH